ncbi:type II toxin-antitoxin system RelB/DinJ family antitoxin (plasmid) [Pseudomonas silesiensis]|uniref:type II toxin-antitoxin system RelB/DinJ family antitoxin n=1 Tax=Pseudomonas silesiensis TaxID=1853130 RepID=UPI0030D10F0E
MAKNTTVRARIDDELKEQAEAVLASYGITMSHAIIMMIRQMVIQQKIPFIHVQPNAKTLAVMDALDRGEMPTTTYESPQEAFKALGI